MMYREEDLESARRIKVPLVPARRTRPRVSLTKLWVFVEPFRKRSYNTSLVLVRLACTGLKPSTLA